jgi:HK97 family phage prohead protease
MEFKSLPFELQDMTKSGQFEAMISTPKIDSHRDKVLPTSFARSIKHNKGIFPILYFHDPRMPVGSSTKMKVVGEDGVKAWGKIDLDTEIGQRAYSGMKFDPPYIDRTSIGFVSTDDAYDKRTNIRTIRELKLMEFSLITRGFSSNDRALVTDVKQMNPNEIEQLKNRLNELEETLGDRQRLFDLEKKVNELLAGSLESTQSGEECSSDDTTQEKIEVKTVIGSNDLPVVKGEWDASEAEKRIWAWANGDISKVKRAYFWVDGDPENKSSYKLPFADVRDGKLVAISNALSAVKGALNGARGGVEGIPDADKKTIMSKVDKYEKRLADEEKAFFVLDEFKKLLKEVKSS